MFRELSGISSFLSGDVLQKDLPVDDSNYSAQTMDWPQNVYYAWVLYGGVSISCSLYWLQRYYMKNLMGDELEYKSKLPFTYTVYGIAESINRVWLIVMWTLTAVVWMLTPAWEGFAFFFTIWARILHYSDAIRMLVVTIMKFVSFFIDVKTDYYIDDGTSLTSGTTTLVTMDQRMTSTDWYMENFGLTVSYSLFGDLMGISKWAKE
jgi:hypothetical protein